MRERSRDGTTAKLQGRTGGKEELTLKRGRYVLRGMVLNLTLTRLQSITEKNGVVPHDMFLKVR